MRKNAAWIALAGCLAIACGGGAAETHEEAEASTGGETVARTPSGPPESYLPQGHKVLMRIDVARIRRSPVAPDISSAIRASTTWQALAGDSGADPIQDFDAILVGADELYTNRRVVVLRTPHDEATVRDRVLRMADGRAEAAGAPQAWREVEGLSVISWPMPRIDVPYSLAITGPHELVLAPDDDLPRIAAVSRDHAMRRQGEEAIEPHLTMRASEISTMVVGVPLPRYDGYPDPPESLRAEIDERDGDGAAMIAIHTEFADEARASAGRSWLEQQSAYYAQQMMVRAIGMNRPLEEMRVTQTGAAIDLGTSLTTEEVRRALGLMALSQLAQQR